MSDIQLFQNPEFGRVRIVEVNGEAWMVGKDVAEALGYKDTVNAIKAHVDDEDKKGGWRITTPSGEQQMTIINESGLYSLVLSSKLPNARKFRRWVTTEVLPTVRKHGAYMTPETLQAAILNPDTMIQLCQQLKAEQEHSRQLEAENAAMLPKAVFADAVSASKSSILVGELAKLLRQNGVDTGEKRLFHWLRQNGYLIKRNGADHNMPTQRSIEQGLFVIKETTVCHSDGHTTISKTPKVTGKGQQYFVNLHLRSM
ncbi:phage antirepressor KilAC domain-containing protein [Candidatus Allofournierella merdipullorum]|uniref:phage antirepressor KilAC domain-containing protein n=1 Tax=Candidatus Allofournierella merdipullorum TaxID=2838595 RepID=UPI002A8AC5E5|nr:phage antirepressor KilAC domain-containing protein [Candidatus Fournierella merdipullorum]